MLGIRHQEKESQRERENTHTVRCSTSSAAPKQLLIDSALTILLMCVCGAELKWAGVIPLFKKGMLKKSFCPDWHTLHTSLLTSAPLTLVVLAWTNTIRREEDASVQPPTKWCTCSNGYLSLALTHSVPTDRHVQCYSRYIHVYSLV